MCGMCGVFHPETDEPSDVSVMLSRLTHRGPDGSGVQTWTAATHGHVRLAIIDPEPRSDQPFVYGGVLLSYVGECWNYRELREWAAHYKGAEFVTESDTEVVAALLHYAIRDFGDVRAALELMDWQGALAVTESLTGRTWLARDRFGEQPLYVLSKEGNLFGDGTIEWASERKAWDAPEAAEAVPVPAGHYWPLGGLPEPYYDVMRARRETPNAEDVLDLLRTAVERRLQADVPVCCLCSGGLDSSLILALVKEVKPDVVAYHATMAGGPTADLEAAEEVCSSLGVPLCIIRIGEPDAEDLRESVRNIEVVSKTQVEIGTLALPLADRLSRDGFKVVLSGEGADELFGGYGTLARKATDDASWVRARRDFIAKMARSDLMRVNKSLFSAGVEPRTPFLDRDLVESVLPLTRAQCPPGKKLLKRAAAGLLPEDVIRRDKLTFQGGAGVADALDVRLEGRQRRIFNDVARELFGGIPRG